MEKENDSITLADLFKMLVKNIFLIAGITLFVAVIGVLYVTKGITPKYTSQGCVVVKIESNTTSSSVSQTEVNLAKSLVATVAEIMERDVVLDKVIEIEGLNATTSQLRNVVSTDYNVDGSNTSLLIYVSAETTNPEVAKSIANAVMNETINVINNDNLLPVDVKIVDQAKTGSYTYPNKTLYCLVAICLGLVLGVAVAFIKELFNNKVTSEKDIQAITDLKILGNIPFIKEDKK